MSAIDDFGCDVDGCQRDAAELVETDDGARVLLCPRCHQRAYDAEQTVTLANGRALAWDMATGWYVLPEGCDGMNDTDTTDHAAELREALDTYTYPGLDADYEPTWSDTRSIVLKHADALAKQLAEAEARIERLKDVVHLALWGEENERCRADDLYQRLETMTKIARDRAADMETERARSARLKRYGMGWEDDFREQMQGHHGEFVEATIQQMRGEYLQPGDLDDPEAQP